MLDGKVTRAKQASNQSRKETGKQNSSVERHHPEPSLNKLIGTAAICSNDLGLTRLSTGGLIWDCGAGSGHPVGPSWHGSS